MTMASVAVAQARRGMSVEDIHRLRIISEVSVSPTGDHCAFVVQQVNPARDASESSIWIFDFQEEAVEQLTAGPHRDARVQWRPQSSTLTFLSDRLAEEGDERTWLFEIDLKRPSEPIPSLDLGSGVSEYAWSPDGKYLCLVRADDPPVRAEHDPYIYSRLPFFHPFSGWLAGTHSHLYVLDAATQRERQLTSGEGDDYSPIWSPDGAWIAFASTRHENYELVLAQGIWIVAADGSESPRRVSSADKNYTSPSFSPDGRRIAFIGAETISTNASMRHLHVASVTGHSEPYDVTPGWDRPAGNVLLTETREHAGSPPAIWSSDGMTLWFIGTDRAGVHLYEVNSEGGEPRQFEIGDDHELIAISQLPNDRGFVGIIGTADRPGEAFLIEPDGGSRQLTSLNASLVEELELGPLERFDFEGRDGRALEGWVLKPFGFDEHRRYPLVLRIPGGPGQAYGHSFVEDIHILAARGNIVAFINPRGTESYGVESVRAIIGDWVGEDFHDQMRAVDELVKRPYVDADRLGVTGASYGGLMTNWIVTQTDRFAAAVSQRSISNLLSLFCVGSFMTDFLIPSFDGADPYTDPEAYLSRSPITHVKNVNTPLLLVQAGRDYMTPVEQALEFFTALRYLGKKAKLAVFPHEQHYVRRYGRPSSRRRYLEAIIDWFDEHLAER